MMMDTSYKLPTQRRSVSGFNSIIIREANHKSHYERLNGWAVTPQFTRNDNKLLFVLKEILNIHLFVLLHVTQ